MEKMEKEFSEEKEKDTELEKKVEQSEKENLINKKETIEKENSSQKQQVESQDSNHNQKQAMAQLEKKEAFLKNEIEIIKEDLKKATIEGRNNDELAYAEYLASLESDLADLLKEMNKSSNITKEDSQEKGKTIQGDKTSEKSTDEEKEDSVPKDNLPKKEEKPLNKEESGQKETTDHNNAKKTIRPKVHFDIVTGNYAYQDTQGVKKVFPSRKNEDGVWKDNLSKDIREKFMNKIMEQYKLPKRKAKNIDPYIYTILPADQKDQYIKSFVDSDVKLDFDIVYNLKEIGRRDTLEDSQCPKYDFLQKRRIKNTAKIHKNRGTAKVLMDAFLTKAKNFMGIESAEEKKMLEQGENKKTQKKEAENNAVAFSKQSETENNLKAQAKENLVDKDKFGNSIVKNEKDKEVDKIMAQAQENLSKDVQSVIENTK